MELIKDSLPEVGNKSGLLDLPESKSTIFNKDYKEPDSSPFQNRRILKYINYEDQKYKEKDYNL